MKVIRQGVGEVSVSVGEKVAVPLEDKGGGYEWHPDADDPSVELERKFGTPSAGVGAHAPVTWEIRPTVAGRFRIRFQLVREWDTTEPPAEAFDLTLVVHD